MGLIVLMGFIGIMGLMGWIIYYAYYAYYAHYAYLHSTHSTHSTHLHPPYLFLFCHSFLALYISSLMPPCSRKLRFFHSISPRIITSH